MQQPLLREHLDELEQRLASSKQLLAAVLTAHTQSMVSGTAPELAAALNQLQTWLQQPTLPNPAATQRSIKIVGDEEAIGARLRVRPWPPWKARLWPLPPRGSTRYAPLRRWPRCVPAAQISG